MAQLALLLTSTTIIVLAGFLLAVLMRPNSAGEVVVGTGALSIVLIEADSLLVGGLLESYRPVPLLLGAVGLLIVVASPQLTRHRRRTAAASARLVGAALSDAVRKGPKHPVLLILGVAVVAAYGVRAYLSVRLPNVDWDGLMYHLVGIDEWVTSGRISHSSLVLWADVYPQSVELFVGWTCVHAHNTVYAGIAQLPILIIGSVAVAGLARRLGARRSHAVLAGVLFLATPAVLAQFGTNYVDAASASLGLAALYLVTGLKGAVELDPDSRALWAIRLATAGLVLGLACGAKSSNLLLAPLAVLYVLAVQWSTTDGQPASRADQMRRWLRAGWSGPAGILLFGLAALAIGGYWHLRTWIKYGNPLYPFTIPGFSGRGTIEELIISFNVPEQLSGRGTLAQVAISWAGDFHPFHTVVYDQRLGGLGMQWVLILLPLSALAVAVWWRGGRRGPAGFLMFVLVGVAAASPAAWWARYLLLSAGLAAALSASGLTWLTGRVREGARDGSVNTRAAVVRGIASLALLGVVGTSMWWTTRSLPYQMEGRSGFLSIGSALDLAARHDRSTLLFPWVSYRAVDVVPRGSSIAVVGDGSGRFTHTFFGNHYEHDVVAVGAVGVDDLSAALSSMNLHYVVIDDDASAILREVTGDTGRFRLLASSDAQTQPRPFHIFEYSDPRSERKDPR